MGDVGGQLWGSGTAGNYQRSSLHSYLVIESRLHKGLVGLATTLDDERLNAVLVEVVYQLWQGPLTGQHHTFGVGTVPVADRQLGMFAGIGGMTYQDGILL